MYVYAMYVYFMYLYKLKEDELLYGKHLLLIANTIIYLLITLVFLSIQYIQCIMFEDL